MRARPGAGRGRGGGDRRAPRRGGGRGGAGAGRPVGEPLDRDRLVSRARGRGGCPDRPGRPRHVPGQGGRRVGGGGGARRGGPGRGGEALIWTSAVSRAGDVEWW